MNIDWLIVIALGSFLLAFLLVYLVRREDRRTFASDAAARIAQEKQGKRRIDYI